MELSINRRFPWTFIHPAHNSLLLTDPDSELFSSVLFWIICVIVIFIFSWRNFFVCLCPVFNGPTDWILWRKQNLRQSLSLRPTQWSRALRLQFRSRKYPAVGWGCCQSPEEEGWTSISILGEREGILCYSVCFVSCKLLWLQDTQLFYGHLFACLLSVCPFFNPNIVSGCLYVPHRKREILCMAFHIPAALWHYILCFQLWSCDHIHCSLSLPCWSPNQTGP